MLIDNDWEVKSVVEISVEGKENFRESSTINQGGCSDHSILMQVLAMLFAKSRCLKFH